MVYAAVPKDVTIEELTAAQKRAFRGILRKGYQEKHTGTFSQ